MAERCGQRSCNAWACLTGKHKHRAFPSWWQSLLASTGSLEENMLPLLWYWISLRVKKDWMLFKFWSVTSHFLFSCEMQFSMELVIRRCRPMQCPLLRSIFRSFVGFWVKIWHRNKTACSESNPVQSSRSKSTTCPVVGRLLRFESNSTVLTDGCAQKLGKDVWHDSESIATKLCSQIGRKRNVMFENSVLTSIDRTSFDFRLEEDLFLGICLCNQPSTGLLDNHP